MRDIWRAVLAILVIGVIVVYAYANRVARYQVTPLTLALGPSLFVVLDTTTGEHWVYLGNDIRDHPRYTVVDHRAPLPLMQRLLR